MRKFLWFGKISDKIDISELTEMVVRGLNKNIELEQIVESCNKLAVLLSSDKNSYREILINDGLAPSDASATLEDVISFCKKDSLIKKLDVELAGIDSFDLARPSYSQNYFEGYSPLGIVTHVAPSNAASVSVLSVIEGLLTKNVNILKVGKDQRFAVEVLYQLGKLDSSGNISSTIAVVPLSSKSSIDREFLQALLDISDGVSAWGGDSAIESIRNSLHPGTRFIPWGHKISFAYVSKQGEQNLEGLAQIAKDCVLIEQQACSSPQTIFYESTSWDELLSFSNKFAEILGFESSKIIRVDSITLEQQSEITNSKELLKLKSIMDGDCTVIESDNGNCRLFVENISLLAASPLNRTVCIRPILANKIVPALFPYRRYLQTAAVLASNDESVELHEQLIKSGVTRVTLPGKMLESYAGEPHDGEYGLGRLCKKVRTESIITAGRYSDFQKIDRFVSCDLPIMRKQDFLKQYENIKAKLFFHSGGSSGERKLSSFTYKDYSTQMSFASEGLLAAGLDVSSDKVINMFFGGNLYGGLISFFTILENLGVCQYPMGVVYELETVGEFIVKHNINSLLGTPTYIYQLLESNKDIFLKYGGIKKIFYGGEHFSTGQKNWIESTFGITHIVSASYGSVDAGPLGYQCTCSVGGEHHLHQKLHHLEILKIDNDEPVNEGEVGRLIFTSFKREGSKIERYDIGDLGKWLAPCKCGRKSPKFELLGRHGDIFRVSSAYVNYNKIRSLIEDVGYTGELQIIITKPHGKDRVTILLDKQKMVKIDLVKDVVNKYSILHELFSLENSLELDISFVSKEEFSFATGSGKNLHLIDRRD